MPSAVALMRLFRRVLLSLLLLALAAVAYGAYYAQHRGFTSSWRQLVEAEFADRGYHVSIGRLTLGPIQGLQAQDVRFFQDPQRRRELAVLDNVILDLDLSGILRRELNVNTLDVQDAKLTLPVTPGRRDSELLRVDRLSGRLVVTENQIEVVRAQAEVGGLEVSVKGSLYRPPRHVPRKDATEADLAEQRSQLFQIRRRLDRVQRALAELERFEFPQDALPRLEIEFSGDLANLAATHAEARLKAARFSRGSYAVEELSLNAEYDGARRRVVFRELRLRDAAGSLVARGEWPVEEREMTLEMESTADLSALVAAIRPHPRLGEVVFFHPPRVEAKGTISLDGWRWANWEFLPLEISGEVRAGRFGSRGAVFDGGEFQFSVAKTRRYVRNLRLDHKSGVLLANLMLDPSLREEAFRFQSEIRLDPRVLLPFVGSGESQRFLAGWSFDNASTVYGAAIGSGESLDPATWHTQGVVDLRRFRRQNVPFERLEAEFETRGLVQEIRELKAERPEGQLTAAALRHDGASGIWEVEALSSALDLPALARAVDPGLSRHLEGIRFSQPPKIQLSGRIDSRGGPDGKGHDFALAFRARERLDLQFLGRALPLEGASGVWRGEAESFRLEEFRARLFGGEASASFLAAGLEAGSAYEAALTAERVAFRDLMRLYASSERTTEGHWSGEMRFAGRLGEPGSARGEGRAALSGGDLLALPALAPALALLEREPVPDGVEGERGEVLPHPKPPSAEAALSLEGGRLAVRGLRAARGGWALGGGGEMDWIARRMDGELTAVPSSLPSGGEAAAPVILRGEGSVAAPRWSKAR